MKKFKVQLHGRNFLLNVDGEPGKFGFHATRFVIAENPQEAGKIAVILIHQSPVLRDMVINESSDRSIIELVEIRAVNWFTFLAKKSTKDITFYAEDET